MKRLISLGLLCGSMVACGGSKDINFIGGDGSGGTSGSGGTGGTAGSGGSGGSGGTAGSGATGGSGGSAGEATTGAAGSAGQTGTGVAAGQGFALAPGGNRMESDNYTLILTTGESPEGNTIMSSDNYRLKSGLVGVTERE
jgi:hypothetical protein